MVNIQEVLDFIEKFLEKVIDRGETNIEKLQEDCAEIFGMITDVLSDLTGEVADLMTKLGIAKMWEVFPFPGETPPSLTKMVTTAAQTYLFLAIAKEAEEATLKSILQRSKFEPVFFKEVPVLDIDDIADIIGSFFDLTTCVLELLNGANLRFDIAISLNRRENLWRLKWAGYNFPVSSSKQITEGFRLIASALIDFSYIAFATILDEWYFFLTSLPHFVRNLIITRFVRGAKSPKEFIKQMLAVYYNPISGEFEISSANFGLYNAEKHLKRESEKFLSKIRETKEAIAHFEPRVLEIEPFIMNIALGENPLGVVIDARRIWDTIGGLGNISRYYYRSVPVLFYFWLMKPILIPTFRTYARRKISEIIDIFRTARTFRHRLRQ